jgi:hypothetical protein
MLICEVCGIVTPGAKCNQSPRQTNQLVKYKTLSLEIKGSNYEKRGNKGVGLCAIECRIVVQFVALLRFLTVCQMNRLD